MDKNKINQYWKLNLRIIEICGIKLNKLQNTEKKMIF